MRLLEWSWRGNSQLKITSWLYHSRQSLNINWTGNSTLRRILDNSLVSSPTHYHTKSHSTNAILSNQATLNVHSSLDFHTIRSTLIIGITLFITFVSFKPKVIFWMSLVDSTAFRFTTNAASLLFVDSIRRLVKLSYNNTFTHYLVYTQSISLSYLSTNTFFRRSTTNCLF